MDERTAARFWAKVDRRGPDECWEWSASRRRHGYGQFGVRAGDIRQSHRVAWELANGPIPDGLCVLHHCDNPPCCNPSHLFLGTKAANTADMVRKGRHSAKPGPVGESSPRAVLTEAQAQAIIEARLAGKRVVDLAVEFGISTSTVSAIANGDRWPHLPRGDGVRSP